MSILTDNGPSPTLQLCFLLRYFSCHIPQSVNDDIIVTLDNSYRVLLCILNYNVAWCHSLSMCMFWVWERKWSSLAYSLSSAFYGTFTCSLQRSLGFLRLGDCGWRLGRPEFRSKFDSNSRILRSVRGIWHRFHKVSKAVTEVSKPQASS